jgi:hypothetical protein
LVGWLPIAWPGADGVWFPSLASDSNCGDAGTMFGCLHTSWWSHHFLLMVWLPPTRPKFSTTLVCNEYYIILESKIKMSLATGEMRLQLRN